jgi:hypothetical protein
MAETRLPGLRTVIYAAPDLAVVNAWYADVLGIDSYFDQPLYVGFPSAGMNWGWYPILNPPLFRMPTPSRTGALVTSGQ